MTRRGLSLLAAGFTLSLALAGEARAADVAADVAPVASKTEAADDKPWTRGWVRLRYDFRASPTTRAHGREYDQDLTQDLFAEGGLGQHLRYELSARVHEDIDGRPAVSLFRDIYDTYGSWATAWLETAYVEALDEGPLARVRLGRQFYDEGVDVRFDGGLVETKPLGPGVKLVAYGGIPVIFFQSSLRGDSLAGGAVELVAIPRTDVRFDYTHLTQRLDAAARRADFVGVPFDRVRDDDRFQVTVVNRPVDALRLFARASTFEGRSTRAEAEATFEQPEWGFLARARYVAQLGIYRDLGASWDPYTEQLGAFEPYHELLGEVRETLFEVLVLRVGGSIRKLFHKSDEGHFNHELARVFGGADLTGWPAEGLTISVLLEYDRSLTLGRTFQASAEVSQEIAKTLTIGVGTQYSAFKLDDFYLVERENVRTYDAFVQVKPWRFLRLRASYAYETNDEDHFHVVRCDARFEF